MKSLSLWLGLLVAVAAPFASAQDLASWQVTPDGVTESGLRLLDGADGFTAFTEQGGARCATTKDGTTPPSEYLYFDIAAQENLSGPVFVIIDYFDKTVGAVLELHYDSGAGDAVTDMFRTSDGFWGGWRMGTEAWKTVVFQLDNPLFRGRQNLGADFRIHGHNLFVRSARLTKVKPGNCEELAMVPKDAIKQLVAIGEGGQFIVGGFDPGSRESARNQTRALAGALPSLKAIGVTSHEGYVRWNLCEPERGRYDWSIYDAYVDLYKQYDMKWVPFLIIGSPYSLPDWYYKKPGSQGYVCLEHGETSDVESLWNPEMRGHVARFIKAFCEHYRDSGVIESILLGITGNYGEAIYIASGNDWTASVHGEYHTHSGFWAGDPFAKASFRASLEKKYGTPDALSKAWGITIGAFAEVEPFLRDKAPNDRAWLDFCDWYIGSMNEWARFWMQETRKNFPEGDIYLCTGGHAPPEHGANFGEQCKLAAEVNGGVRITNEGSDYRANFTLTRWVASGGRQYGAYFAFEPAGRVDPAGVIARIYNATASGAKGLHYYYPNLFATEEAHANFVKWGSEFKQRDPIVEVALYYPQTHIKLNGQDFLGKMHMFRDCLDTAYLSDEQILDGGLASVKALILAEGNTSEAPVWQAIVDWVRAGGIVFYADGLGHLRTVEGDESAHEALFGKHADLGKGRAHVFKGKNDSAKYRAFVVKALAKAKQLSRATRTMASADGEEDLVFATVTAPDEILWMNYTDKAVTKDGFTLDPYSITAQKLSGGA